ncbi:hypothetical protein FACS189468_6990 [Spirochaetia bacterium]|nr:hypothetical protein FACS189468_6990 [Spirochaetia bacterium]
MAVERRKYTRDYKEAAVAMAEREDKTVGQVARELGINASMLARWRSEMREAQGWLYLTIVLDLFDRKVIGWAFRSL